MFLWLKVISSRSLAPLSHAKTAPKKLRPHRPHHQKTFEFYHSFPKPNTIKMAPTKEYALLCLENPLLGIYSFLSSQLKLLFLGLRNLTSAATEQNPL
jgi:hypothetical protein